MEQAKVFKIKLLAQKSDDGINKSRTITSDDNIINVEQQIHNERLTSQDE